MPRPILKRSSSPPPALGLESLHSSSAFPFPESSLRHVNFPVSSQLCVTHAVHSPGSYDRSPIVVDANTCALPARGCPGRTYSPAPPLRRPFEPCPELCSSSSESDESSDGFASPPPELWSQPTSTSCSPHIDNPSSYFDAWSPLVDSASSTPTQDRPLSFLPHPNPHSPPPSSISYEKSSSPPRPSRATRRLDEQTPKPKKKKKSSSLSRAMATLAVGSDQSDDGCLGGF